MLKYRQEYQQTRHEGSSARSYSQILPHRNVEGLMSLPTSWVCRLGSIQGSRTKSMTGAWSAWLPQTVGQGHCSDAPDTWRTGDRQGGTRWGRGRSSGVAALSPSLKRPKGVCGFGSHRTDREFAGVSVSGAKPATRERVLGGVGARLSSDS